MEGVSVCRLTHREGDGGETRLGNLVTLCRLHHRLVHEGGFEARVLVDGAIRFHRPDGEVVPPVGFALQANYVLYFGRSEIWCGIENQARPRASGETCGIIPCFNRR